MSSADKDKGPEQPRVDVKAEEQPAVVPEEVPGEETPYRQGEEQCQGCQDLQQQLEAVQHSFTRLAADFDNFRKRAERNSRDIVARANQGLIASLLPVLDNFHLALQSLPKDDGAWQGVEMIFRQLEAVLAAEGLEKIEAEEKAFDPREHEAVAHVELSDKPDNMVVEEVRRGYKLAGRVLRPSLVKVNKTKDKEEQNG